MRRPAALALACAGLCVARPARAQRPDVSPILRRVSADSVVPVWLFARPATTLDAVARFVARRGGHVRRRSRWLHAVSADLDAAALAAAATRRDLRRVQPVRGFRTPPPRRLPGPAAGSIAQDTLFGASEMPFRRLNLLPLVARGFRGAGVRIALLDTGFETGLAPFAGATVLAQFDFVFNDTIVRNEPMDSPAASAHGTQVWSLLAANVPGTLVGVAPEAGYVLAKTEDIRSETRIEEDNYVAALEWADSIGVDIVSSSVMYTAFDDLFAYQPGDLNGDIAVTTVAADLAAERGILVVTAAGNLGGTSTPLATPADGDSVLAVGAEDSLGTVAPFSGRGPTADGRTKPDVSAPGVAVLTAGPSDSATPVFVRANGTSYATPLIAGAAALFHEVHPTLSPLDALDALRDAGDLASAPDNDRGWGRPDVYRAVTFPRGLELRAPTPATLDAVTPTFTWSAPNAAAFAQPLTYHVVIGQDSTLEPALLDSVLLDTTVTLLEAQLPGATLFAEITATTPESVSVAVRSDTVLVTPAWVTLETFNEPGGTTTREFRPRLTWHAPAVAAPPGPFVFDVEIIRAFDGTVAFRGDSLTTTEFIPPGDLERNTPYRWRVRATLGADTVAVDSRGSFVIVDDTAPRVTTLYQNFPNPFPNAATGATATCVWFDLAVEGVVRLDILDLRGHIVRTLIPVEGLGPFLRPGRYGRSGAVAGPPCDDRLTWDGRAATGAPVPPGIYLAKLSTPDGTFFKRIAFLGGG